MAEDVPQQKLPKFHRRAEERPDEVLTILLAGLAPDRGRP